ncbi:MULTISPECIES: hypothetical protein [unclassified Halorubrum]|uniref:hypothetical protein n=1 Tax=unclassified Halorubrum TaxID=2642239 RepID=UPI0010F97FD1|nr:MULTISPECIES: hypothetical protein [unclassified Halorubrum]TKX40738.1 hypothetical protein EXE52_04960 [Halorubrum sp. CGM4_25_10-8A]TKX67170.1 hypothetical protein EXE47_00950 [Halorubrum sp. GN12_10-3_MGM]
MAVNTAVNFLTFVIEEVGAFAFGAAVVGWVARDLISQHFDKELSKYQAEVDKELNRYQTELEKDKLQFSELHTQRAEITAELYERFVEFEEDMRSLTDLMERSDEPPKDEKLEIAAESGNQFINFYMKNKIYFPPQICETVEELNEEMRDIFVTFRIYMTYDGSPGDPHDLDQWHESWKRVTEDEVPELKSELEDRFRDLLGVEFERDNDTLRKVETEQESETDTAKE